MLRNRRPWFVPLCLFVYTTAMFLWLLPQNQEADVTEKIITVVVAYLIIGILFLILKKKDKMARERENDINHNKNS